MENIHESENVKEEVRRRYAGHARASTSCCGGSSCCAPQGSVVSAAGYGSGSLAEVPEGADLGLGCGDPLAFESLSPGETVVDLGSGGGIDCFLAARRVGEEGRVIGVDMTPEMVLLATRNAAKAGVGNCEFRLGEIEDLPLDDGIANLVISNCVINLVPDKDRAFAEAFRVLKPGGRLSVSDIVTTGPLPDAVRASAGAYVACLGGASLMDDYLGSVRAAGFEEVEIAAEKAYVMDSDEAVEFAVSLGIDLPAGEVADAARLFRSVTVHARKPER